jgi:rhodanese-related sulfurtransferase
MRKAIVTAMVFVLLSVPSALSQSTGASPGIANEVTQASPTGPVLVYPIPEPREAILSRIFPEGALPFEAPSFLFDLMQRSSEIPVAGAIVFQLIDPVLKLSSGKERFEALPEVYYGYRKIDVSEAHVLWTEGALFIDIRHPTWYNYGHIDGAVNAPFGVDFEEFENVTDVMDKSAPVVLYCQANRPKYGAVPPASDVPGEAAAYLVSKGFRDVYTLEGEIEAWKSAGYPLSDPFPIPPEWKIKPEVLYASWEKGEVTVIDVRLPFMYETCHAVGAINVPADYLAGYKAFFTENFDKDDFIVCYCNSGAGAIMNVKVLRDLGFNNVYSIDGGLIAWKNAGYPIEGNNCGVYPEQLGALIEGARSEKTGASP